MNARTSDFWAGCGLALFGAVVGLLVALSETAGTVTALLGLLFALIGGSFAAVFKDMTPEKRRGMMHAAGVLSIGLLAGLLGAFGLKGWERSWSKGLPPTTQPAIAQSAATKPAERPKEEKVFALHSGLTTDQQVFNQDLGTALSQRPAARTDEDQKHLQNLANAMGALADSVKQVEQTIQNNPSAVSDDFKASFSKAFPSGTRPAR